MRLWVLVLYGAGANRGYYPPDPPYTSVKEIPLINPPVMIDSIFVVILILTISYLILYIRDCRRSIR